MKCCFLFVLKCLDTRALLGLNVWTHEVYKSKKDGFGHHGLIMSLFNLYKCRSGERISSLFIEGAHLGGSGDQAKMNLLYLKTSTKTFIRLVSILDKEQNL